jgi:hypothetical protein
MIKKYLISIIIINILIFPYLSLAQTDPFEELGRNAKPAGETIWQTIKTELPKMIKKPWQDALIAWKMIFSWAKSFWNSYLSSWLKFIWEKIVSILGKEVEQRKSDVEQEFKKETEEIKQDIPETTNSLWSLWQRLKDLVR